MDDNEVIEEVVPPPEEPTEPEMAADEKGEEVHEDDGEEVGKDA